MQSITNALGAMDTANAAVDALAAIRTIFRSASKVAADAADADLAINQKVALGDAVVYVPHYFEATIVQKHSCLAKVCKGMYEAQMAEDKMHAAVAVAKLSGREFGVCKDAKSPCFKIGGPGSSHFNAFLEKRRREEADVFVVENVVEDEVIVVVEDEVVEVEEAPKEDSDDEEDVPAYCFIIDDPKGPGDERPASRRAVKRGRYGPHVSCF